MKQSLILGAGSGIAAGAIVGSQAGGGSDHGENAIKGALIGGVIGGVASYFIHESLENRDVGVRKDTLMNLEHYDVMGFEDAGEKVRKERPNNDKCFTTQEVDGRLVSIPCRYSNGESGNR